MPKLNRVARAARIVVAMLWAAAIATALTVFIYDPSAFTSENIAQFLRSFEGEIWIAYFIVSAIRGITLLPSTPLVIAGTILFPEHPLTVLLVSLAGIFISSSVIYYFSEFLGLSEYFEGHKPEMIMRVRRGLEHPLGLLFVAAWSFFPLVPTDAVCYVAGTSRMRFPLFIFALVSGELLLCSIYIFFGGAMFRSILG